MMAYMCVRVPHKECDCCMECTLDRLGYATDEPVLAAVTCEECGRKVDDGYYYNIEGTVLCADCVDKLYRCELTDKEGM